MLASLFPAYRSLKIHESSPSGPASAKLRRECTGYVPTQYFPGESLGQIHKGFRCENLEAMTFPDEAFDLIVTQDVLEHVLNPPRAFAEIARTLKPGGAHIFTVPLYKGRSTVARAVEEDGSIRYLESMEFHSNPVDPGGSLVVTEWGDNLLDVIQESSGLHTDVFTFDDRDYGLQAEFLDVFVSTRAPSARSG